MAQQDVMQYVERLPPSANESEIAKESRHSLAKLLGGIRPSKPTAGNHTEPIKIEIRLDGAYEVVALPISALELLNQILGHMAEGHGVSILPTKCELTTVQAADVLNVSRPYLIGLLEQGKIPFRLVGTHRRILLHELLQYKQEEDRNRKIALRELSELSEELGLDD